jgi:hypothetical protein
MSLTRKDFEAVALSIRQADDKDDAARLIADYFETQNRLFDRDRFLKACATTELRGADRRPL